MRGEHFMQHFNATTSIKDSHIIIIITAGNKTIPHSLAVSSADLFLALTVIDLASFLFVCFFKTKGLRHKKSLN